MDVDGHIDRAAPHLELLKRLIVHDQERILNLNLNLNLNLKPVPRQPPVPSRSRA